MTIQEDQLNRTFAALANTTRRAILARLAESDATVNELAKPFNMSLPAISQHIKVLERAGLIIQGKKAQYRPCKLDVAPLKQASDWATQTRTLWEQRFDQLDDYLNTLTEDDKQDGE